MQSNRKLKAFSLLSMAVAATMGAKATHAATLTLYYDNIIDFNPATSTVVQSYSYGSTGGDYSAMPTSINIAQGDILEFGIDAVVTNNINPDAGKLTGTITVNEGKTTKTQAVQPSYMGMFCLSIVVPSTDKNASQLVPNTSGPNGNTFGGLPDYNSTASLNNQSGLGTSIGPNNNPGGFVPNYTEHTVGDIVPGSSVAGDIGDRFGIFDSTDLPISSNTLFGANTVAEYGAAAASFGNATDFFDSLAYTALDPGIVALSPFVDLQGSAYWINTQEGSATVASGYQISTFTQPGDVAGTLPSLVVNISSVPEPMSLGLLALGGLGLLTQRPRRQK